MQILDILFRGVILTLGIVGLVMFLSFLWVVGVLWWLRRRGRDPFGPTPHDYEQPIRFQAELTPGELADAMRKKELPIVYGYPLREDVIFRR